MGSGSPEGSPPAENSPAAGDNKASKKTQRPSWRYVETRSSHAET